MTFTKKATENPGYPGATERREACEDSSFNLRYAVRHISRMYDDYLSYQYHLRDMAYICIKRGDTKGAMKWLAEIGEDK